MPSGAGISAGVQIVPHLEFNSGSRRRKGRLAFSYLFRFIAYWFLVLHFILGI